MKNTCIYCGFRGKPDDFQRWHGDFNLYNVNLAACPRCSELLAFDERYNWDGDLTPHYGDYTKTDMYFRETTIDDLLELRSFDLEAIGMMQEHILSHRL